MNTVHEHPALDAWTRIGSRPGRPVAITALKERKTTAVYAIHGVGPGNRTVVAKRSAIAKALVERTVYEHVLPQLPVASIAYYGFWAEQGTGWGWIFIEQASGAEYSPLSEAHRVLAARWLGLLHGSAASLRAPTPLATLPDRYLDRLRSGQESIERGRWNPSLARADRDTLAATARRLARLRSEWSRTESLCAEAPRTLVHGDFAAKNMVVRVGAPEKLLVFDWGTAGWGVPAADLAQNDPGETFWVGPDLTAYRDAAGGLWSHYDREGLRMLAGLGKVFRALAAIDGDAGVLASPWAKYAMPRLSVYLGHLCAGMTAAGFHDAA